MTARTLHRRLMRWVLAINLLVALGMATAGRAHTPDFPMCKAAEIRIDVLPFDVTEDFSVRAEHLDRTTPLVGLVRQTTTVQVDGCTATVGYANPVLYVASELRPSPCAFQTVFEHESHHVAIYRRALLDLDARIRAAAADKPLFVAAVQEVKAVEAPQNAFDNPTEYRKNLTACHGDIYRLSQHRPLPAGLR